mmetsp:Transcript_65249/g.140988  ORF Transcript_65249/g.140988 Transcript_65249/m.140988 type:complete len:89 (-) Transcript_65249:600-866(-)
MKDIPSQNLMEASKQGIRIPLSLSEVKESFDRNKQPCRVVDCAFASVVAQAAKEDEIYRSMLIGIIFERIKEKYKFECKDNFKIPNIK